MSLKEKIEKLFEEHSVVSVIDEMIDYFEVRAKNHPVYKYVYNKFYGMIRGVERRVKNPDKYT